MKLFLFALFLLAATSEMCAAVRPAEKAPEKGSWPFYSREKKSKIAPEPALTEEAVTDQSRNINSQKRNAIVPEKVKKSASLDSTDSTASLDSETSGESENEKRIRTNEIRRYFEGITDEILESHYLPKVQKHKSLPWLIPQAEKEITEQYNRCSRGSVRNRLITCTGDCISNAFELFSSLGREAELENLCIRRCTNSGKLFIAEKAEQIENYNSKRPIRR